MQEAYVQGVSTRRVDEIVKALGLGGISKSQVSRLCAELDAEVERFRTRRLEAEYPYVWLDGTFLKVRVDHRIQQAALVIAVGVRRTGEREVLGLDLGPSEDGAFWLGFLRSLVARGLCGVRLVTSDSHEGLKQAIAATLHGATWQRCRVHTIRTQSHVWRCWWVGRRGRWRLSRHRCILAAQGDDVADLQVVVVDDDTLDQQRQDGPPVGHRRRRQAGAHPRAECLEIPEHRPGVGAFAA